MDLKPIGTVQEGTTIQDAPNPGRMDFTLTEMSVDYAYFHPGAMFTQMGLDPHSQDPVLEWVTTQAEARPGIVAAHEFSHTLFRGFGQDSMRHWDRSIFAVRKDRLDSLLLYLCGTVVQHAEYGMVSAGFMSRMIPDPAIVGRGLNRGHEPQIHVAFIVPRMDSKTFFVTKERIPRLVSQVTPEAGSVTQQALATGLVSLANLENAANDAFMRELRSMHDRTSTPYYQELCKPRDDARGLRIAESILKEQGR